jgi:hypothetical protein
VTPRLPASTATTTHPRPALTRFERRTTQGVSVTFALNDSDPTIKAVRDRLRFESSQEVRWGRNPIAPACLPYLGFHARAVWRGDRAESVGAVGGVADTLPQGAVQAVYTADDRHRILVLAARTTDPRVASLEFQSGGLVDRQRTIDGWTTLVLVVPAVGIPGDVVPGVLTARAADGSIVARVDPNASRAPDPCLPPFQPVA